MPEAVGWSTYDGISDLWDLMIGDRQPFIDFYASLADGRQRSLLDVGCGTGVITEAVAMRLEAMAEPDAIRVTGVDGSDGMLEVARRRYGRGTWLQGDMRDLRLPESFDLAISTYNTLQHISPADLVQVFRTVRNALSPEGLFAFDIYQPNFAFMRTDKNDHLSRRLTMADGRVFEIREDTHFDAADSILTIDWRMVDPAHRADPPTATAQFRLFQHRPEDVLTAVVDAGLRMRERFGELDRSTFAADSRKQVLICARA